jgi:hypothetical protein
MEAIVAAGLIVPGSVAEEANPRVINDGAAAAARTCTP